MRDTIIFLNSGIFLFYRERFSVAWFSFSWTMGWSWSRDCMLSAKYMEVSEVLLIGFSSSEGVKAPQIQMLIGPVKLHCKCHKILSEIQMIQRWPIDIAYLIQYLWTHLRWNHPTKIYFVIYIKRYAYFLIFITFIYLFIY